MNELLESVPVRNVGRFGRKGDPWNLLFVGSEDSLSRLLVESGWTRIPVSIARSTWRGLKEILSRRRPASFPPMNDYRLLGKVQSHNWAKVVKPITARHHFRLWKLPYTETDGRPYWWGSGNYDRDCRCWDLSHVPDPDTNMERDYIASTLEGSPRVESMTLKAVARIPHSGANDKGYPFRHDGKILVVRLRN